MRSPVLFLIFNRPDTTERVFEEIRKAQPPRLYIAADGPRANRPGEKALCKKTRAIARKVDWDCEVKTLFRDENLGCGRAVSQAITWFFDNEPEGIILEDDILPHPDFFPYCDELLDRYRDNKEIGIIAGHNHMYTNLNRESSYGFLVVPHIWGWATWRDRWALYDFNLRKLSINQLIHSLKNYGYNTSQIRFWKEIYNKMKNHAIDTWDYQWALTLIGNNKLNATPYHSMTKNIGFSANATHTTDARPEELDLIPSAIFPISNPELIKLDKEAECLEISQEKRYLKLSPYLRQKIKNYLRPIYIAIKG